MRLGISTYTYGWAVGVPGYEVRKPFSEIDLLNTAKRLRVDTVQIGDNLPLHEFTALRMRELRDRVAAQDIRLEIGARGLTRDHVLRYIDIANNLNAPLVRFITDDFRYEPSLQAIIEVLYQIVPSLEKADVKLGIENHDRLKARELAFVVDSLNQKRIGICLDCVNSLGAGEGIETVLNELAPYTINLHIKDFVAKRLPHKMGFTVTGAETGKGQSNIPYIINKIALYHKCESAILEQWVPPEENLEDTLEKEQKWADEGIQFLKSLPQFVPENHIT